MAVAITDLDKAVISLVQEYCGDVKVAVAKTIQEVGREGEKKLQGASPKLTGGYAKGWKFSQKYSKTETTGVTYNAVKPGLAHLLEKGHGPTTARPWNVKAKPHIWQVERWMVDEAERKLKERLS